MATVARYEDRQVAIGRVFARAFATIAANPVAVFGIAFLFGALPGALVTIATQALATTESSLGFAVTGLAAGIASLVFTMTTQGALVRITVAHSDGIRAGIGAVLVAGLRAAVPLLLLAILVVFGVVMGLTLFFVPGVILYVMWSVAAPVVVVEGRGVFAALARSRALTKGARWRIFALGLVVLVFYWLIAGVVSVGSIFFSHLLSGGERDVWWFAIGGAISTTLTAAVWGTIHTSLYVELRDWKDGPASDRLADIFA